MTYQSIGLDMEPNDTTHRLFEPQALIPARWLTLAVSLSGAVVLGLMIHNRLTITPHDWGFPALVALCALLTGLRVWARDEATLCQSRCRDFGEHGLLLIAICTLGGVASYEAAGDTTGFVDPLLARLDGWLHFDWLSWYTMVVRHPLLQYLGAAAYGTIYVSPWAVVGWLAWTGQRAQARRFLLAFWLAALFTLMLFPLFPAKGALEYLWHGPIPYMPTNGLYQGALIPALRAHTVDAIHLGSLRGLVCAPSFHTASATIFIATAWSDLRLRRVLVPMNIAMLLSTPVEGTHYLSDMVMGLAVALVAIALARAGSDWLTRLALRPGALV